MFNQLSGFFDRNFIVAYLFPALIFVLAGFALLNNFNLDPKLKEIISDDLYKGATIVGVVSLIIAVFLQSLNFKFIRLFEGYGKFNPLRLLQRIYDYKFFKIEEKKIRLKNDQDKAKSLGNSNLAGEIQKQRNQLHRYSAEHYPPKYSRVLPTAFGNAIRAFEDYSEEMYGVDAIVSWVRLLAVIPKDFRDMTSSARAQVDLWVNFRLLSYILIIVYGVMVSCTGQLRIAGFPVAVLVFAYFASVRSVGAAVLWGDFVKSSYDLYLPDLRDQIRLRETDTVEEEIQLWNKFSRQVIYHSKKNVLQRVSGKKDSKNDKKNSAASEE